MQDSLLVRTIFRRFSPQILLVMLMLYFPLISWADASLPPEYQYLCNNYYGGCSPIPTAAWVDTVQEVADQECNVFYPVGPHFPWVSVTGCVYSSSYLESSDGTPRVTIAISTVNCGWASGPGCNPGPVVTENWTFAPFFRFNPARYYASVGMLFNAEPGACCQNSVAEPINPSSGAVIDTFDDFQSIQPTFGLKRFYNNLDVTKKDLSPGWHHSFDRKVSVKYSALTTQLYAASASNSSAYTDPESACVNGFAEIQSKVPSWAGAMALYSGGNCQLTKSGVSVGSVPMNYTRQSLPIASTPIAFDAVRDDGQVIRFTVQTGLIITPPGTALKLLQTVSGFTLTDDSDNIEVYDSNGRLLSVTSRTGVVQTMNYDGAGKLGGVTDNFGHQLTLGYDAQNRLISVTRQ